MADYLCAVCLHAEVEKLRDEREGVDSLRSLLVEFVNALDNARRFGAERDEPEGARYVQISDTLAKRLSRVIRGAIECP